MMKISKINTARINTAWTADTKATPLHVAIGAQQYG